MAEYEERNFEDLTEEPSAYRLEELRSKGQVAQSKELTSTLAFLGVCACLYWIAQGFLDHWKSFFHDLFNKEFLNFNESNLLNQVLKCILVIVAPLGITGMVIAAFSSFTQTGFIFNVESLSPDFKRVDPLSGLKKIFSSKSFLDGLKSLFKFVFIIASIYLLLKNEVQSIPSLIFMDIKTFFVFLSGLIVKTIAVMGLVLLVFAGFDYWIQWRQFRRQAMMTKAEAKREMKEREGDPQLKARIRSIQRDMARKRMMKDVPKADVIVTNPTHIAVALQYDANKAHAPRVIAKGGDFLAERIKKVAREHNIPTVENVPLARTLYKYVKVGQMIPRSLYQAVAEILAYVYRLNGKKTTQQQQAAERMK